ncbi:MAG TPA: sigma-70 family RNA polymerase sigma factor [Puia sp.]|jgi:RNA polymerase sigma-70 factor (ECF subfamily)|nr:sigma-70 family RNA polymerase sigma factor [Puia sp.]
MEMLPDVDMQRWSQFKDGDREAFAAIYQQHILQLITYGFRLCADQDLLKDQIQELFVELWQSRKNLAPTRSVKFYLFKALRYKLIRLERNRYLSQQSARIALTLDNPLQEAIETSIIENESRTSRITSMREAIKTLSLRQQEAIQLRYYQGFTHDQIAELMDLNYQSVSNLLHRALSRLKEVYKIPAMPLLLLGLLKIFSFS